MSWSLQHNGDPEPPNNDFDGAGLHDRHGDQALQDPIDFANDLLPLMNQIPEGYQFNLYGIPEGGAMSIDGYGNILGPANSAYGATGYHQPIHESPLPFDNFAPYGRNFGQHYPPGGGFAPPADPSYYPPQGLQYPVGPLESLDGLVNPSIVNDNTSGEPSPHFANPSVEPSPHFAEGAHDTALPSKMAAKKKTPSPAKSRILEKLNGSSSSELSLSSDSTEEDAVKDPDYEYNGSGEQDDEGEEGDDVDDQEVKPKSQSKTQTRGRHSASKRAPIRVAEQFAAEVEAIGYGNGSLKEQFDAVQEKMQEAMAEASKKLAGRFKESSLPDTRQAEIDYVNQIFDAIKNMDNLVDNQGKKGQAQAIGFVAGLDDVTIKMKCWELYFKIRRAYAGEKLTPAYYIQTKRGEVVISDFDAHIKELIHGLKICKAVCKSLFDAAFIDRLAEAPEHELNQKVANQKINATRDYQNATGRAAIGAGLDKDTIQQQFTPEKGMDGHGDTSTPTKLPRSRKSSVLPNTPSKRTSVAAGVNLSTSSKRKAAGGVSRDGDGSALTDTPSKKSRPAANRKLSYPNAADSPGRQSLLPGLQSSRGPSTLSQSHTPDEDDVFNTEVEILNDLAPSPVRTSEQSLPDDSIEATTMKVYICRLLGIDAAKVKDVSLLNLRLYAYAYNTRFQDKIWSIPGFNSLHFRMYTGYGANPEAKLHIGLAYGKTGDFAKIALARGDLTEDFKPAPEDHHIKNSINTSDDLLMDGVLGYSDNPCGFLFRPN